MNLYEFLKLDLFQNGPAQTSNLLIKVVKTKPFLYSEDFQRAFFYRQDINSLQSFHRMFLKRYFRSLKKSYIGKVRCFILLPVHFDEAQFVVLCSS